MDQVLGPAKAAPFVAHAALSTAAAAVVPSPASAVPTPSPSRSASPRPPPPAAASGLVCTNPGVPPPTPQPAWPCKRQADGSCKTESSECCQPETLGYPGGQTCKFVRAPPFHAPVLAL